MKLKMESHNQQEAGVILKHMKDIGVSQEIFDKMIEHKCNEMLFYESEKDGVKQQTVVMTGVERQNKLLTIMPYAAIIGYVIYRIISLATP
jgi:hypothetical protein